MLVRDPVFVKQLFHFFCHHVTVIRNREKGDLFAGLRLLPKVGSSRFLGGGIRITHRSPLHHAFGQGLFE